MNPGLETAARKAI